MTLPVSLLYAVDVSPLIVLAKVGRLDLLTIGGQVRITETVYQEVLAGHAGDPARQALTSGFGQRTPDVTLPAPLASLLAARRVDSGEAQTLALGASLGGIAVVDDLAGRKAARSLGVPHVGTSGLVVEGKRLGIVASARNTLYALSQAGLFLPREDILTALLATVGETWP